MMLTSKGRYAVMAVSDIALYGRNKPVNILCVAKRQGISVKYLEQICVSLRRNGILKAFKGPGGGYQLSVGAKNIKIADVMDAVNEPYKMTRCDNDCNIGCMAGNHKCVTHDLWAGLSMHIKDYFISISIHDVVSRGVLDKYFCLKNERYSIDITDY